MEENKIITQTISDTQQEKTSIAEAVVEEASGNEAATEAAPAPEQINAANAAASTGNVSDDGQGAAFFTAADVRAMSREQVRRNLSKILKSMESDKF